MRTQSKSERRLASTTVFSAFVALAVGILVPYVDVLNNCGGSMDRPMRCITSVSYLGITTAISYVIVAPLVFLGLTIIFRIASALQRRIQPTHIA